VGYQIADESVCGPKESPSRILFVTDGLLLAWLRSSNPQLQVSAA
jgi:HrpA-like RNA helicase